MVETDCTIDLDVHVVKTQIRRNPNPIGPIVILIGSLDSPF